MSSERRLLNLMKKLIEDDCFISGGSPRMTHAERRQIEERLGTALQVESLHGTEPGGPVVVYPLDRFEFAARVRHYILADSEALFDGS